MFFAIWYHLYNLKNINQIAERITISKDALYLPAIIHSTNLRFSSQLVHLLFIWLLLAHLQSLAESRKCFLPQCWPYRCFCFRFCILWCCESLITKIESRVWVLFLKYKLSKLLWFIWSPFFFLIDLIKSISLRARDWFIQPIFNKRFDCFIL